MLSNSNVHVVCCLPIETTHLRNTTCRRHMLMLCVQTHKTKSLLLWVFSIRVFIEVSVLKTVTNVTDRIVFRIVPQVTNKHKQVICKIQCNLIMIENKSDNYITFLSI